MNRRDFVKVAIIAGVGLVQSGSSGEDEGDQCGGQSDPVIESVGISEHITDGDRGAVRVTGMVGNVPCSFEEVNITMWLQDEDGEHVITLHERIHHEDRADWAFNQNLFADAERIEEIEQVSAAVEVIEEDQ